MFDSLQERLSRTLKTLTGTARLTDSNIQATLRDLRRTLLEADVALPAVDAFIDAVRTRALGQTVAPGLNPGQQLLKTVQAELIALMGGASATPLNLAQQPPAVILLAGLQGAGKTTSAVKLARFLTERERKKVLLVSTDVHRPAALEQLAVLGQQAGIEVLPTAPKQRPLKIAKQALASAKKQFAEALIVDTAGRQAIDPSMMAEIRALQAALRPAETLFVLDAMTGQDAVHSAKAFHDALTLTGAILTKADGDARGGAALSVRHVTGQPIKFIGTGEKTDALEPFHPERIASRILGMGDMHSLIEQVERKVDSKKAAKLVRKITASKGRGFDLEDMRTQLQQMRSMGGAGALLKLLPGNPGLPRPGTQPDFARMEVIISSMTPAERRNPAILNGSRKRRITRGSGTRIQDLMRLLKHHKQMQKTMKKMGGRADLSKLLPGAGGTIPGLGPGAGLGLDPSSLPGAGSLPGLGTAPNSGLPADLLRQLTKSGK
ncbi:MAG: signal recognition particle protein [Cellvibrionales bacterium]|nr:signal recognition particle protein [Cellvibrionales bacterium]